MSFFRQVAARRTPAKLALAIATTAVLAAPAWWAAEARAPLPTAPAVIEPVALSTLPPQAQRTQRLILQGGPFPYEKDGTVFHNRERLLPLHPRGYYREYTVKTPGSPDRGARRIVCGGTPPTAPETCYYTADHYASLRRIVQ